MKKHNIVLLASLFLSFAATAQDAMKENAPFQKVIRFDNDISKESAITSFLKRQGLDSDNSFIPAKETSDESGLVHQRHQQFYKGLKVEFGMLITHTKNGKTVSINGEVYNASSLSPVPSLSAEQGLASAMEKIQATRYLWQDVEQSNIFDYKKPQGELLFFPIVNTGEMRLAYKYDIYTIEPLSRNEVYVDANNGEILYKNPIIKHVHSHADAEINKQVESFETLIMASANTKYSGPRSIETRFDTPLNKYVLHDTARGGGIITYNNERLINTYQNVHFQDSDNNWTAAEFNNSFNDIAGLDAHWGAEMTFDFWKNVFNRNSFDDNNAQIISYVHFRQTTANLSNAFWNGSVMSYGDGSGRPYTTIDISGHEIGHAVCTYTAALAYRNQSGAMNEGFSDIWGACIEHYGRTGAITGTPVANVWKIGEDAVPGGFRSMSTPLTFGNPDTFQGTNYTATADDGPCTPTGGTSGNDYCGVHNNSGVLNHWFYILTAGKSGTNNATNVPDRDVYNVTGIGMQKSSQIAYYLERDYLTANSTFFDARDFSIEVASNLYCPSAPETIAVTNAWNAVNVGDKFAGAASDVSMDSLPDNNSVNCGVTSATQTVTFKNLGTTALTSVNVSYNVDGGANANVTWTGNVATCSTGSQAITINTTGLSPGVHILNVTTTTSGDGVVSNNTKSGYILVNQSASVGSVNTFESPTDNLLAYDELVSGTSLWQRGTINKSELTDAVAGNSTVYATGLTGNYPGDTKSYLISRCYDLSQTLNPVLKFDMAFDLEFSSDILYMQYSTNGGAAWSLLGTQNDANWYTANTACTFCVGGEWTGEAAANDTNGLLNGVKRQYRYNLSALGSASPSPQSNVLFRFVFQSDSSGNYDGALIDNFVVENELKNDEFSSASINLFPNPTRNLLNYSIGDNIEISAITINDISGKQIYRSINIANNTIDVSGLASGVYFVTFKSDDSLVTKKFIKE